MQPRFGLYVHWPFCAAKCPYCDFNSHVAQGSLDIDRWRRAYLSELERVAALVPDKILSTIFFGGGTPSLMPPKLVADIIETAARLWRMENSVEISLEANPTSIEMENFAGFRTAGVNRVSMGVQALSDADLRKLGRMHTAAEALQGLDIAQATFDRVSIDLIYARQHQTAQEWEAELRTALGLGLDHLSLYQLTIEPGTVFAKRHSSGRLKGLPEEDLSIDLWDLTQAICGEAGMPAYEVSNHARAGAESRHNLIYWTSGDWAGIGPGAHGRLTVGETRLATETALHPEAWLQRVESVGSGEIKTVPLDRETVVEEYVLMGLRLRRGIDLTRLAGMGWAPPAEELRHLSEMGFVQASDTHLRVTDTGRPVLNAIIQKLLT